jgi:8-oxo-dGTP diphosphatase
MFAAIVALLFMLSTVTVLGFIWWLERPKAWLKKPFAWRFCPGCRGKLVKGEVDGKLVQKCSCCSYVNWNNPIPVVVVVIPTADGRLVLIRRLLNPGAGSIALVAGFVDANETPEQAAVREAKEEASLDIEIDRFLGTRMPPNVNQHLHFFLAKPVTAQPVKGSDAAEVLVKGRTEIPFAEIKFSTHREMIESWLAM